MPFFSSETSLSTGRFGVVIPVGPTPVDVARGMGLLWSLIHHEPSVSCCVILDNSREPRGLSDVRWLPATCRAITLTTDGDERARGWSGGLTTRILAGLAWTLANTTVDFVLRIDTDALVIAPFVRAIQRFLDSTPDVGIVGTVGLSCNPRIRAREDLSKPSKLLRAHQLLPAPETAHVEPETIALQGIGRFSSAGLRAFNRVREHVNTAFQRGYTTSEFCQGGAYVVTRGMLERMNGAGYLQQPEVWADLPFSEDRVMAMYARAVDLAICDYSEPGDPFGLNYVGLAYTPDELARRGHSVIHSVRNDMRFTEAKIRAFFNDRRGMARASCR